MNVLITVSVLTLIVVIILLVYVFFKNSKREKINLMVLSIEGKDSITDCFSKDVIGYYLRVLNNPNSFSESDYTIDEVGSEVGIWCTNSIINRRFYTHKDSLKEEVKEMNAKLNYYDKLLLDKLSKTIIKRQNNIVTKLFI